MYGSKTQPAPPLFASLTKLTVGVASQLSASPTTTLTSGAGTLAIHCTLTDVGVLDVGSVSSTAVIVVVTSVLFPQSSITGYVLVTMYGSKTQAAPPLFASLTKLTVGVASQLSASPTTTLTSGAGTLAIHCTPIGAGFEAVGAVLSLTLNT